MKQTLKKLAVLGGMFLVVGSMSACSTTVAPEDSGTTEYIFKQTKSDQVLSKDDSITSSKVEGD